MGSYWTLLPWQLSKSLFIYHSCLELEKKILRSTCSRPLGPRPKRAGEHSEESEKSLLKKQIFEKTNSRPRRAGSHSEKSEKSERSRKECLKV
jgi:hypothetical protein